MQRWVKRKIKAVHRKSLHAVMSAESAVLQASQVQLAMRYRELAADGGPLPSYRDVGIRVFCDADEDGILLFLLAVVGGDRKVLVDLGSASVDASNTSNLVLHHGWTGLLVDGNAEGIELARSDYRARGVQPPTMVGAWLTAENVNDVIAGHGVTGEIGLLSIDIDGNDYWIWRAIDVIRPRVVVIEYQDILGPERSVTIPYDPSFNRRDFAVNAAENNYVGASLRAMVDLGKRKGYRLVATNAYGFNAFFVREDLGIELLPEIPVEAGFPHPWNEYGMRERYPLVADMPWESV